MFTIRTIADGQLVAPDYDLEEDTNIYEASEVFSEQVEWAENNTAGPTTVQLIEDGTVHAEAYIEARQTIGDIWPVELV